MDFARPELVDQRGEACAASRTRRSGRAGRWRVRRPGCRSAWRRHGDRVLESSTLWNRCSMNCGYCDAGRPARQERRAQQNRHERRAACSATQCPATRSSPRTRWPPSTAGWRRLVSEIGVEFGRARALDLFRAGRAEGRGQHRLLRPRLRARAGRQGARASSTCRPATPRTPSTSATTRWRSARSTGRRSCARARCAATPRWRTSATSPGSPRASPCSTRRAGSSASRRTRRWTRGTWT